MRQFTKLVHDAVMGSDKVSVPQIAEALDKAPSTVYAELNPYPEAGRGGKLGLDDAMRICDMLDDIEALRGMAQARRCALVDLRKVEPLATANSPARLLAASLDCARDYGQVAEKLRPLIENGSLTRAERKRFTHAAWGLIETLLCLDAVSDELTR